MKSDNAQKSKYSLETKCVHGDYDPYKHNRARALPIYTSAAFCYDSSEHAASLFALEEPGSIYMRLGTPTTDEAEKRCAMLENGIGAVSFASGMAALSAIVFALMKSGDVIAASNSLYGGSMGLLSDTLPSVGIITRFFNPQDPESLKKIMSSDVKLIITENLANPGLSVPDHEKISQIAKENGVVYLVDNTLATPMLCRPIEFGADVILHSSTKYMMGHGDAIGGLIIDAGTFAWRREKYPLMFDKAPDGTPYAEKFGANALCTRLRGKILMNMGGCMAPFNAFLLVRGLESLHVRMERHCANAEAIAKRLSADKRVAWVNHPSLSGHQSHEMAKKYLGGRFGAMLGFGLKGGYESCRKFIDNIKLLSHTTNIGDTKTLVIHPASTTHRNMTAAERQSAGITDDFIRMSVGIENADDIMMEIEKVL
jgi:O-acetylhomoserine (thiol)-lyase